MGKYSTENYKIIKNKHTKKEIKYNDNPDKIVVLNKITIEVLEKIKEEIIQMYVKNKHTKRNIRETTKKINEIYKDIDIEKLFEYYFEKNPYSDFLISIILYKLKVKEYILLPFMKKNKVYYSIPEEFIQYLFKTNNGVDSFGDFFKNFNTNLLKQNKKFSTFVNLNLQKVYFSSSVNTLSDLSYEFVNIYTNIQEKNSEAKNNHRVVVDLKRVFTVFSNYYEEYVNKYDWKKGLVELIESKKKQGKYKYLNEYYDKKLISDKWLNYINVYLEEKSKIIKHMDRYVKGITEFVEYLIETKNNNLDILELERNKHIKDISNKNYTFISKIKNMEVSNNSKNTLINAVLEFFDFIKIEFEPNLSNLISSKDKVISSNNNGVTVRNRIPKIVIETAKEILLENNFEFNKWYQDNQSQLRIYNKEGEKIYWNGFSLVIYLLMTYPVRNKQIRWLDSGELDEYSIDFDKMEYVKNKNPYAIKGRKSGCIQIQTDYFTNKKYYILHINTNKTGKQYNIPYLPIEIINLIKEQIEWNKKHNKQIIKPIKAIEKRKHINENGIMEDSCPLFLYPNFNHKMDMKPISDVTLSPFYYFLLQRVEERLKEKYNQKISLTIPKTKQKERYKTLVDIHSLRVSGITNLIEAGVPTEIVSQFVAGHSSTIMTLYYNKNSLEEINKTISSEYEKSINIKDEIQKLESYEEFNTKLISANKDFKEDTYKTLTKTKEYWNVSLSGICTTNCTEQGREDKCCPKCPYWITGSPFVVGQTVELNDTMFKIRKKANKVRELNGKYLESFSEKTKGEIELLNDDLTVMINEWSTRYKFIEKSLYLLNNPKQESDFVLIKTNQELKLGNQDVNDFGLSYHISQNSRIIEEYSNNEANYELDFFVNKILSQNSIEPFMFKLNREDSKKVSSLFAQHLLENYNNNHIEELIEGKLKLENNKINEINRIIKKIESNSILHKGKINGKENNS